MSKMKIAGNAPRCPFCSSMKSKVIDKRARDIDKVGDIYRRRECFDCGGRFPTWEVGKQLYDYLSQEKSFRFRALMMFKRIKNGLGIDRFENLSIIKPSKEAHELWNDEVFVKGIEYGVLLALQKIFKFEKREIAE